MSGFSVSEPHFTKKENILEEALCEYGSYLKQKGWFFCSHHLPNREVISEKTLRFFSDPYQWLKRLLESCHSVICQEIEMESDDLQDQILEFCLKKSEHLMPYRLLLQEIFLIPDFKAVQIAYSENTLIAVSFKASSSKRLFQYFQIHHTFLFIIFVQGLFIEEQDLEPLLQQKVESWFSAFS